MFPSCSEIKAEGRCVPVLQSPWRPFSGNDSNSSPLNVSQRCQLRCSVQTGCMMGDIRQEEMQLNHTTAHTLPPHVKPGFPGYYVLIPFLLITLTGCILAVVFYIRRRTRLDELRHRLIPLYSYDPAEQEDDWGDTDKEGDLGQTEPLYKEGKLYMSPDYGS